MKGIKFVAEAIRDMKDRRLPVLFIRVVGYIGKYRMFIVLCILIVRPCILIVVYVYLLIVHVFLLLSMYSYCCLCILIVRPCILIDRPCILIVVYVFLLLSMCSYCLSMYSYRSLCILIAVHVFLDVATLTEVFPCFFFSCKANASV